MQIQPTTISDVLLILPKVYEDERGFFLESYNSLFYADAGIDFTFVQDNHSRSRQGVLRGLHYQLHHAQGKLIHVVNGEVFDVAVDLRRSSPTFGKWVGTYLSAENKLQLWVPPGFAHGYYVLSDWADFLYKATDFYTPEWERTIHWNDSDISIEWPLIDGKPPLVSPKDAMGNPLVESEVFP